MVSTKSVLQCWNLVLKQNKVKKWENKTHFSANNWHHRSRLSWLIHFSILPPKNVYGGPRTHRHWRYKGKYFCLKGVQSSNGYIEGNNKLQPNVVMLWNLREQSNYFEGIREGLLRTKQLIWVWKDSLRS